MKWIYGIKWEAINKKMLSESKKIDEQNSPQVGHFEFDQVEFFHGILLSETEHFVQ